MIVEFQKHWEEEYKIKTTEELQSVIDKRNTHNEKNTKTQRDRNTTADMDESKVDGDDDDEGVILRMRMGSVGMGQGAGVVGQSHTPNGDRFTVFTSQLQQ